MTTSGLNPPDWARPIEKTLVALWDAVDAADLAVSRAVRSPEPVTRDLRRFSSEFDAAKNSLVRVLLDVLSPDEECAGMPDTAQVVS